MAGRCDAESLPHGSLTEQRAAWSLLIALISRRLPPVANDQSMGAVSFFAAQHFYRAARPYVVVIRTVSRLLLLIMNPIMAALASCGSSIFSIFRA